MAYLLERPMRSGAYPIIPKVGHAPAALWDVNYGLDLTSSGTIYRWRDVMNDIPAYPLTQDMVLENARFSGSRTAISFNGTTQGFRAVIPGFARIAKVFAAHAHFVPADNNAVNDRAVLALQSDAGFTGSGSRGAMYHTSASANLIRIQANEASQAVSSAGGWGTGTEIVAGMARVANVKFELFIAGASGALMVDSTVDPISLTDVLCIGHISSLSTISWPFYGSIRRVALYNTVHDDAGAAEAGIINTAWSGK